MGTWHSRSRLKQLYKAIRVRIFSINQQSMIIQCYTKPVPITLSAAQASTGFTVDCIQGRSQDFCKGGAQLEGGLGIAPLLAIGGGYGRGMCQIELEMPKASNNYQFLPTFTCFSIA